MVAGSRVDMVASWHPLPVTGGPNLSGFVPPTAWNLALDVSTFGTNIIKHVACHHTASMKFQEEYRDRCHLSLFQRYRAFHPFSDWLSQVEVFPAPVARGRNMCCVAHWARWEKSLKCLKEWSYTVVKSENKSTYRLLILDTILFFSSGCFLFVALIEWVLSSKVCR